MIPRTTVATRGEGEWWPGRGEGGSISDGPRWEASDTARAPGGRGAHEIKQEARSRTSGGELTERFTM